MKIYKASEEIDDHNSRNSSKFSRKSSDNSYRNFAKKEQEHLDKFDNSEGEKFISYEDFYAKNGQDAPFGGSSFVKKTRSNFTPQDYYDRVKKRREKIAKRQKVEQGFRENLANGNLEDAEFMITKIAPAAKTPGRYNVFVNEEFSFSLDETQLVDSQIKKGEKMDSARYLDLKNDSDFGKNYIAALDLISRRMRSEKEIRDYGFRKKWSKNTTEKVVKRLGERGYLNDETFAKMFVNSRANLRNFSRKKMEVELIKKGINKEVREKVLTENENFDEQKSLKKMIEKKWNHYADDQKMIAYLARQGFNFDDIKNALRDFRETNEKGGE